MIEQMERVARLTAGCDLPGLLQDEARRYAVVFCLVAIGESASRVAQDIVDRTPEIPWRQMRSMRNILVHEYLRISGEIVWRTATERLPEVLPALRALVEPLEQPQPTTSAARTGLASAPGMRSGRAMSV
jgi:uncharacterized protein with HEPN domain